MNSFLFIFLIDLVLQGHHPDGGAHAKFTNYEFDVDEFLKIIKKAEKYVMRHPSYKAFLDRSLLHDEL